MAMYRWRLKWRLTNKKKNVFCWFFYEQENDFWCDIIWRYLLPAFEILTSLFKRLQCAKTLYRVYKTLNLRSRKLLELSQRTGFPRCTLNGLGDIKNVPRRRVNTSRKTKKTLASWRCFGQSAPYIRWCTICMYLLNMFGVCQLC